MGYIYKIYNDINNKIYIGKTVTSISKRWSQHRHDYLIYDWHLYKAMRKYGFEHFFIEQIEESDNLLLNEREKYWIEYYDSYKNGYNSTVGGDGRNQLDRELVKQKWEQGLSTKQIANDLNCWPSTIVNILKEINLYDKKEIAFRKQVDIANTQADLKIIQYNEYGVILNTYNSVLEASRAVKGLSSSIRTGITSGGSRYGYFWGRENGKLPNFHKIKRPQIKKVYQFTKDKKLIGEYNSAAEAAKVNNFNSPSSILKVCKGERKSAYNFLWSYDKELI